MNLRTSRGINLVLRGGGVKGIAIVGALKALEEENIHIEQVGGASAGALIAALHAAGYKASELRQMLTTLDFASLLDPYWSRIYGLVVHRGMHKGIKLRQWVDSVLQAKLPVHERVVRFVDLPKTLKVVTTNLYNNQPIVFTTSAAAWFERDAANMLVAEAVRASCSIPLFFTPLVADRQFLVDGGVLANFPMWLFQTSPHLTIGINLVPRGEQPASSPRSLPAYISRVLANLMQAAELSTLVTHVDSIIHVPVPAIPLTQFSLTSAEKDEMYDSGFNAAKQFIVRNKARLEDYRLGHA